MNEPISWEAAVREIRKAAYLAKFRACDDLDELRRLVTQAPIGSIGPYVNEICKAGMEGEAGEIEDCPHDFPKRELRGDLLILFCPDCGETLENKETP